MPGGGDGGGQSTTVVERNPEPWSGIQPYLTQLFSLGQQALQSGAGFPYTGRVMAPLSPYTQAAIDAQTQVAGGPMSQLASQLGGANAFALSPQDVMGLGLSADEVMSFGMNNPYFNRAIRQATRPVLETGRQLFQQQADTAQGAGAYGGTRDVMVAGDLGRKIAREVGNISSGMASQNYQNVFNQAIGAEQNTYNQALDLMGRGLALGPQTLQALLAPSQVYGQIGGIYDARNQERINALINQYNQVVGFPWTQLGRYASVLGAGPTAATGGSETSTVAGQGSSLGSALGSGLIGGATGYAAAAPAIMALNQAVGGGLLSTGTTAAGLGATAGPWGAAIGGLLGLLGGFL
jgi:hypothetical protein